MPLPLLPYDRQKLAAFSRSFTKKKGLLQTWWYLEPANIIGLAYLWEHTYVYWLMLKFGFGIKSPQEVKLSARFPGCW